MQITLEVLYLYEVLSIVSHNSKYIHDLHLSKITDDE